MSEATSDRSESPSNFARFWQDCGNRWEYAWRQGTTGKVISGTGERFVVFAAAFRNLAIPCSRHHVGTEIFNALLGKKLETTMAEQPRINMLVGTVGRGVGCLFKVGGFVKNFATMPRR